MHEHLSEGRYAKATLEDGLAARSTTAWTKSPGSYVSPTTDQITNITQPRHLVSCPLLAKRYNTIRSVGAYNRWLPATSGLRSSEKRGTFRSGARRPDGEFRRTPTDGHRRRPISHIAYWLRTTRQLPVGSPQTTIGLAGPRVRNRHQSCSKAATSRGDWQRTAFRLCLRQESYLESRPFAIQSMRKGPQVAES